jgi:DNA-binding beta-propeller fold protein YncE
VGDVNNNPDHCAQQARGLEGVAGLNVSADGRSLYAVSYNGSVFAPFNRDRTTGALTPRQCWGERGSNFEHCPRSTKGLLSPTAVIASADGKSVYVAGSQDNALVRFDRNAKTLAVTPHGCIADAMLNPAGCAHTARGLNNSFGLALSPDGGSLYVASEGDSALARFDRSPGGALTSRNCVGDMGSNGAHCAQTARGLLSTFAVAVAPKGRSVYAISDSDSALVRFDRQP